MKLGAPAHFLEDLRALLNFLPPKGSLLTKKNKNNYQFSTADRHNYSVDDNNLIFNYINHDSETENPQNFLIMQLQPIST